MGQKQRRGLRQHRNKLLTPHVLDLQGPQLTIGNARSTIAHIFTFLTVSSEHGAQEESLTSLLYRWPHTAALRFQWCILHATHGSRLPPMITYIYCQIAYRRDIIPYHIACKRRPAFVARLAKLHRFPLTWPQRPALYGSYSCGNADSGSASLLSLSPLTDSLHTGLWVPLLLCFSLNFFSQLPLLYSS
jgi:hypothetical protein